jgi:hypothetical protein
MSSTMSKTMSFAPALSACAAAAAIVLAPIAAADEPTGCAGTGNTSTNETVCQSPGDASIVAPPPNTGNDGLPSGHDANVQNGPYGPSGSTPPLS